MYNSSTNCMCVSITIISYLFFFFNGSEYCKSNYNYYKFRLNTNIFVHSLEKFVFAKSLFKYY